MEHNQPNAHRRFAGQKGLTAAEVAASRAAHGCNILTPPDRIPWWRKFLDKFRDPLIIILLFAGALSIGISCYEHWGLGEGMTVFFEPVGIIVAILLATGMAFWFEWQADREFNILSQQNDAEPVQVVRDGRLQQIPRSEVVVGDVALLNTGDEVPADGLLLEAVQMQVDESSLTGEPVCSKSTRPEDMDGEATFPTDHVLKGTKVVKGHGIMHVEAVGDKTESGRVFTAAQIDNSVRTPLNEQLDRLGQLIARASYAVAALVVCGRLLMYFVQLHTSASDDFELVHFFAYLLQSFMLAVTLIVVAVPEGLPMAVTLALAYSMRSMLKTNNLVRRLHACETMGAATVICTDKTGTLTQNQMRVAEMRRCSSTPLTSNDPLSINIAVNSTASLSATTDTGHPTTDFTVMGNPTEGALLLWLQAQGINYTTLRDRTEVIDEVPFTTERKYMASRTRDTLYIKGAPEIVMNMCAKHPDHQSLEELLTSWQTKGMRTLAFAHGHGNESPVLDAIVAIADPVRPDVPAAVRECIDAGISVKVVTGDTPTTATEIARQIGLLTEAHDGHHLVLTGPEVAALSDEELRRCATDIAIVARARPMDKQRLVEALQACGEVVAVTGDGTNDAPALHAAHVGLSMGDGTAVAKEASDITIIDNSFASIGRAVLWGRSLYKNIQRFILFQLTVNVCACLTVLTGAFMGTEPPLTVTQMLWVNLIMDTFAAMALASLPPSEDVMHARPRDRQAFIITRPMQYFIFGLGGMLFVLMTALLALLEQGGGLTPLDHSVFFTTFVMLQFWNLFNAKAFFTNQSAFHLQGCRGFLVITALIFFGQILIIQLGGSMFNVVPLDIDKWIRIILYTSSILIIGEMARAIGRRWTRPRTDTIANQLS